jgi:hypothetical protein
MLTNIKAAFLNLKSHLIDFLKSQDDCAYRVNKLSHMLGENVRISEIQAQAEVDALNNFINQENQ